MTSNPASRSARATSLAPRSWPSRPGLATSTRTGSSVTMPPSEGRRLLVLAPHVLQLALDLADRAVLLDATDQRRHEVRVAAGGGAEPGEGVERSARVASPAHLGEAVELQLAGRVVHDRRFERGHRLVGLVTVHAHDDALAAVDPALDGGGLVGDQSLHVAVLDAADHAAARFEVGHDADDLLLHLVGERLDEVRAAERVDRARDARLVGEDLLRAQRERRARLGRE